MGWGARGTGSPLTSCGSPTVRVGRTLVVLQDEATRAELKSGLPMFSTQSASERRLHSGADEMQRLPYLQGMPTSLQSLFRGR
jgi:hypothetical protein